MDPLHDVTLEKIVTALVDAVGFPELATRTRLACFLGEPSVPSVVAFLRDDARAREKIERCYLLHLRDQERRAERHHARDLRGAAGLVIEATKGVTSVVERMHGAIGAFPIITDLVYASVRGVTSIVGASIDAVVAAVAPLLGESAAGDEREAMLAVLNGVVGDHLEASGNALAIDMALRPPLDGLHRGGTLLVMVHGSCMNDLQWRRGAHDHGRALADELGFTPTYAHYNSGRHISTNGADLAALLEQESAPFTDVVVIGHSMGGLVARAAIRAAEDAGLSWRGKLRALVTLGSPHHGAPLERQGNALELVLGATKYSAPLRALGQIRSAGVTDLRYGNVVDGDWRGRDRFAHGRDPRTPTPLPDGVRCFAVAATTAPELSSGALPGDGLVPVESGLGHHSEEAFALHFTDSRVVAGTTHLDLLSRPEVYALLLEWLAPPSPASAPAD